MKKKLLALLMALAVSVMSYGIVSPVSAATASGCYRGFDMSHYPGDATLKAFWNNTPFSFCGFYLGPTDYHSDSSWMANKPYLERLGYGLVLYVGQQADSTKLTAAQGKADADNANSLAKSAGFMDTNIVVYLDVETHDPLSTAYQDYLKAYMSEMYKSTRYQVGVYCAASVADQIKSIEPAGVNAVYYICNVTEPLSPGNTTDVGAQKPADSSVSYARIWQYNIDESQTFNGKTATVDLDLSNVPSPSSPSAAPAPAKTATLQADLAKANGYLDGATVGSDPGDYSQSAKDTFGAAIDKAQGILTKDSSTQSQVNQAGSDLKAAVAAFRGAKITDRTVNQYDPATGIAISAAAGVIPADTELDVTTPGGNDPVYQTVLNALKNAGSFDTDHFRPFVITLRSNGAAIEPEGKVQVTVPIPAGFDKQRLVVFSVDDNGNVSKVPFTIDADGTHVMFETDHFSIWGIGEMKSASTPSAVDTTAALESNPKTGDNANRGLLLAVALLSAAVCVRLSQPSERDAASHRG